ncbi:cytochrome c oxidase assembly protein [Dictyobacter kobayashii]|uniref:Membrane protein n=1 Tax=Dictyobacter kobayashii TaxID=2014872 RepID=A0A402AAW8_9CHLR|nr:cytochrome c oxidase assembly protein [Dictyobacter kobayashii]GCE16314.1 membrane protein [Dictyobacter kobayashii]
MMQNSTSAKPFVSIRTIAFIFGWIFAVIAFAVPMDIFGMYYMFTVHMAQHLLLSLVAPPLILLGVAPESLRRFLDRHTFLQRCFAVLTIPVLASLLFNGNIWIWHAPVLMRAMISSPFLHDVTNLLYLVTGLFFWCPLLERTAGKKSPLSLAAKLAYLFFSDMPMMLLGAGLTFSPPLYTFTMSNPSMHMAVTATDQQLGGLLMWVVGGVFILVIVTSVLFLRWMLQQEKEQQAKDRKIVEEENASMEIA